MVKNIFENIIEISLSVSVVIALLIVLSKVLDKNYTAKWRYWVWLILAIRLIIPVNITLPDPPINLSAPEKAVHEGLAGDQRNVQTMDETTVKKPENESFIPSRIESEHSQKSTTNNQLSTINDFKITNILTALWITGAALFLMYHLIIYFSYRKNIKAWCKAIEEQDILKTYKDVCEEIKINKTIPIMMCGIIKSPMVLGFWKPVLLLPDMTIPPYHMKMILRHELIHVKRRDVLYKALILLTRATHWFNPLVHLMAIEANKDVELSCDAAVVENQNIKYRKDYSEAILSVIHKGKAPKAVFSTNFDGGKRVLKKRFASLFDLRKKRKGIISLIMVVLIISIMGLCISCTQNTGSEMDKSTGGTGKSAEKTDKNDKEADNRETGKVALYINEKLGFSLNFPVEWKDRYIIEESDDNISVFCKKVYDKYKGAGLLFTMQRAVGELITEADMQQAPVMQQIVLQGNGYTYFTRRPSDIQYPPDDEEVSSDYETMSEQIINVPHWISLLGDEKPAALNEGFKVAGSSFFTVEIPSDWRIEAIDVPSPRWGIYDGDNLVGTFDLIPYRSEGNGKESKDNDNVIREYLFNNETCREFRITLNSRNADGGTMEKIKNSFKFVEGPFNIIDLQSNALQYLAEGGKKVFGTIQDFEVQDGKPVVVHVNVMKFLSDDENNEYPNGFNIEDLNRIESYPLDFGVSIAPLVPPDYNSYGMYEMPLLDENYIKKYENYKDFYYDFIIGNDGQLKIILGHYVP
ncbi:MAG TPA: hypothetical protein GXX36_03550 [Clostridiaceae bacterium]|nr:hypothetical protein [Clostridiaceae bacterium]